MECEDVFWCLAAVVEDILSPEWFDGKLMGSLTEPRVLLSCIGGKCSALPPRKSLGVQFEVLYPWFSTLLLFHSNRCFALRTASSTKASKPYRESPLILLASTEEICSFDDLEVRAYSLALSSSSLTTFFTDTLTIRHPPKILNCCGRHHVLHASRFSRRVAQTRA